MAHPLMPLEALHVLFSISPFFKIYFLLLFSSGYYEKQGKALYKRFPVAALKSTNRKFLSALQVSVVETVANLAATAKLATSN